MEHKIFDNSGNSIRGCTQNVFLNFRKLFPEFLPFHSISDRKSRNFLSNGKRPKSCMVSISMHTYGSVPLVMELRVTTLRAAGPSLELCLAALCYYLVFGVLAFDIKKAGLVFIFQLHCASFMTSFTIFRKVFLDFRALT